jgi:hypothetical protein
VPAVQVGVELAWRPEAGALTAALGLDYRDGVRVSYDNLDNPLPNTTMRPEALMPAWIDLSARVTWETYLDGTRLLVVLRGGNLLNRKENTADAAWTRDPGRNDAWRGQWAMYTAQAPPINGSLTFQLEM